MRLFTCTWLCPDNQTFYGRQMAELVVASGGLLRAIPRDSAHVTCAFLPHVTDAAVEDVVRAAADVAARHAPVSVRLGPPAILFARTEARLLCTPIVHGATEIMQLGANLVAELERRLPGVEVRGSRSPHVTLARFRRGTRRGAARTVSDALMRSAPSAERDDLIAEVCIVASELTASAPKYVTLARTPLG